MSRPQRELKKKFVVFCEGDTEYNYIDKMRIKQGVEIALEPINMKGGGYSNFLNVLKIKSQTNCIAKFIIMDADRILKDQGEKANFQELLEYCMLQNKKQTIPHFLIVDNPDFEYVACLHVKEYKGQDIDSFITRGLGFRTVDEFKAKKDVYVFLNSDTRTYQNAIDGVKNKQKLLKNQYTIVKKKFDIQIKETVLDWDRLSGKCSNIEEFFDVIDW